MSHKDIHYMARALVLAARGRFTTDPNPRVGCVLVRKDEIIAEGWHERAGQPHAEVNALQKVDNALGATAYVTLEPCSYTGRTGPCCEALIDSGVERVVVAMEDPNPLVSGQGIEKLRLAGIEVICGVLQRDAMALNRGFINRMRFGKPWVRSKLAMSLDGRTAMASGESRWITSDESRADVQILRAESSAILTGISTVLADDPSLTVRLEHDCEAPVRVVLDSQLRMPLTARMLSLPGETWVMTVNHNAEKITALQNAGAQVFVLPASDANRVDLSAAFACLAEQQINNILVEAGATLNGVLLDQEWVDEWIIYMAPCVLGDRARGLFHLPGVNAMADRKSFKIRQVRQIGSDIKIQLQPNDEFDY